MSVSEDTTKLFDAHTSESGRNDKSAPPPNPPGRALVPVEPLHRMHEGRIVRSAGRMLVGSPVPVPTLEDILNDTPVFSGRRKSRWRISSGAAVALTCLLAVGAAVTLTHFLGKRHRTTTTDPKSSLQIAQRPANSNRQSVVTKPALQVSAVQTAPQTFGYPPGNLSVKDVSGAPGVPLRLAINVANASPDEYSFMMIRGLPAQVTVSAGFRMKDAWAVSLRDLDGLTLQTPVDYAGNFRLEVLLIKGKDQPTEIRQISVIIQNPESTRVQVAGPGPSASVPNSTEPGTNAGGTEPVAQQGGPNPARIALATPAEPLTPTPPPTKAAPARPVTPAEESAILAKAHRYFDNADIVSARLLLEYLARRGSSKGALELAQSYDPAFFDSGKIRGMRPEADKAREWYAKASEYGNEEAAARLRVIAGQ